MQKVTQLPVDYAVVLQQIDEDGGEDFNSLVEVLQIDRPRLAHIVRSLHNKGLLIFNGSGEHGFWMTVSRKGERLIHYMWPESRGLQPSF